VSVSITIGEPNHLKKPAPPINSNEYFEFIIDGLKVLVIKNTKRIVIEKDIVTITR